MGQRRMKKETEMMGREFVFVFYSELFNYSHAHLCKCVLATGPSRKYIVPVLSLVT